MPSPTTTLKQTLTIPTAQIPTVVKNAVLADIDALAKDLSAFFEELKPIADQRFTMMKNKKVWYDRENVAIYPKFEEFELPQFPTNGNATANYSVEFEGFRFVGINRIECMRSFMIDSGNPYLQDDGNFRCFHADNEFLNQIITSEIWDTGVDVWYTVTNGLVATRNSSGELRMLIPIHRFQEGFTKKPTSIEVIWLWLSNGLMPDGLRDNAEKKYKQLLTFVHFFSNEKNVVEQELTDDMQNVFRCLKDIATKKFVMMKNKAIWFDRDNAAIFPRFENSGYHKLRYDDSSAKNKTWDYEGFNFVGITCLECVKTYVRNMGNPYMDLSNNVNGCGSFLTSEQAPSQNYCRYTNCNGYSSWTNSSLSTVWIPIHRFCGKNSDGMNYIEAITTWIENGLIPEGLSEEVEAEYQKILEDNESKKVIEEFAERYNRAMNSANIISLNKSAFAAAVLNGEFNDTIFGYDFNLAEKTKRVLDKTEKLTISPVTIRDDLLNCDKIRADLQPYSEDRLTDINLGHWELAEVGKEEDIEINLPQGKEYVARPPQMDVIENGTCAIDFGTKSTVVVCRSQDARLLRVGKGNLSKAPTADDYENPTVIELRDMEGFMAAYNGREGRPFTEWEQMTVSHQAAEAIFQNDEDSSVYYSVFGELKQWANAKGKRLLLKDRQGKVIELKPYDELTEDDFDPIEFYAYYLGLYINNMHNRIYLDYILSFPVTYEQKVREHIRRSFEKGIRKSLPPALLKDKEIMEMFRVSAGASEPAAYAISALEEYGLQPQKRGDKLDAPANYAVFDFGGGTTDYDFGTEEIPEDGRRKFVIRRFGAGGDPYLGGENILDLLAYEVYKDNIEEMRKNQIPIVLPPNSKRFAGSETLVFDPADASQQAYMNSKRLARELRSVWERRGDYLDKFKQPLDIVLFSSQLSDGTDKKQVNLKVMVDTLEKRIEKRIRQGVENFFTAMMHAFDGKPFSPENPIHIFLAGNSCKSAFVHTLFDEYIAKYEKKLAEAINEDKGQTKDTGGSFKLYPPLGISWTEENTETQRVIAVPTPEESNPAPESEDTEGAIQEKPAPIVKPVAQNYDQLRTGKTGVAFGLLRTRIGGKDVKIIDEDSVGSEIPFSFYLGDIDRDGKFRVRTGRKVTYGEWVWFAYADDPEFELYYTKEANSLKGEFTESDVSRARCRFDAADCSDSDDVGVYIKKVNPNTVEYAVGQGEDFASGEYQGKTYTKQLKV